MMDFLFRSIPLWVVALLVVIPFVVMAWMRFSMKKLKKALELAQRRYRFRENLNEMLRITEQEERQ